MRAQRLAFIPKVSVMGSPSYAFSTKSNTVFVVKNHYHCDRRKGCDSSSNVVSVHKKEAAAVKTCIVGNTFHNAKEQDISSVALFRRLVKTFPNRDWKEDWDEYEEDDTDEVEINKEARVALATATQEELFAAIAGLSLEKLKAIDAELVNSMEQIEPEFSELPTLATFTFQEIEISK